MEIWWCVVINGGSGNNSMIMIVECVKGWSLLLERVSGGVFNWLVWMSVLAVPVRSHKISSGIREM